MTTVFFLSIYDWFNFISHSISSSIPYPVFSLYVVPVAVELMILVYLVRNFRIKRNTSWGKVTAIFVAVDIAYYFLWRILPVLILLFLVVTADWSDGF